MVQSEAKNEYAVATAGEEARIENHGRTVAIAVDHDEARHLVAFAQAAVEQDWSADEALLRAGMTDGRASRLLYRIGRVRDADREIEWKARAMTVAIIDVETTGLDVREDKIIELAAVKLWLDEDHEIIGTVDRLEMLEDPGFELTPEITKLTGIKYRDVKDHKIDDNIVADFLSNVDLIISHNAAFDRAFFDRRFPNLANFCWACSIADIPWKGLTRTPSNALLAIAWSLGWDFEAHRARNDIEALAFLLTQDADGCQTPERWARPPQYMRLLIESAMRERVRVTANGAPFEVKDRLKARGYSWNARRKLWSIVVPAEHADSEVAELKAMYGDACEPGVDPVAFHERFRDGGGA